MTRSTPFTKANAAMLVRETANPCTFPSPISPVPRASNFSVVWAKGGMGVVYEAVDHPQAA
jgi:hypothetical protein